MTKSIGIFIPTINAGGAEKQAVLLASRLALKYNVCVILYAGDQPANEKNLEILNTACIPVYRLIGGRFFKLKELKRILKQNKIEILFNYLTMPNVVGSIVGKMVGVNRIYNGIRNSRLEWWKLCMERMVHNYWSTATIFNCYSGAKDIGGKGFKHDKSIVIPNCFPNISEPILRTDAEIKHIVTVGRFVPQKDYKTIIETISYLKNIRQDFVMDIIGYGAEEENIRTWIKHYGVEKYIKIHIRPNNVQEIVKLSDVYLSTSLFEGTSNSIMEALNWSLPVVATNVGDNDHLVIDGKTGFLHPIGDSENLANSLSKLLDSSELRNRMGTEGNQNLRENYSMEIFEKRYFSLIEG